MPFYRALHTERTYSRPLIHQLRVVLVLPLSMTLHLLRTRCAAERSRPVILRENYQMEPKILPPIAVVQRCVRICASSFLVLFRVQGPIMGLKVIWQ